MPKRMKGSNPFFAALTHMDSLPIWVVDFTCKIYLSILVMVALSGVLYVCVDFCNKRKDEGH